MLVKKIAIKRINPAPYNPRKDLKPEDPQYKKLLKSIETFGLVEPPVWNKRTGHLVGGHQRFKILIAQGHTEVKVVVVDLSIEEEKALNVALNKIDGSWDQDKLGSLLNELTEIPDFDLELTGFDFPEVESLIGDESPTKIDSDDLFDIETELKDIDIPITQPGDLIRLGYHRLLCGDAAKAEDVCTLMGDDCAQLLVSDPPYNVSYTGNNRPIAKCKDKTKDWKSIRNDHMSPERYRSWFCKILRNISSVLTNGSSFYLWNGHRNFGLMSELIDEAGFHPAQVITWAKESFAIGFGDYNEQTEFCLYGWKLGARHRFYGPKNASTLWEITRDRTTHYQHPTQKALELAERAIRYSSQAGDLVLDPFLGSGTTLIAAARLGRKCFGLEIEPTYCDVIVRRFIALAGETAVDETVAQRYRHNATEEAA